MTTICVYHREYGCESGCCGYAVRVDGHEIDRSFDFDHPTGESELREFARVRLTECLSKEEFEKLDFENSVIVKEAGCF